MTISRSAFIAAATVGLCAVASRGVWAQTTLGGRDPFTPLVAPAPPPQLPPPPSSPSQGRRLADVSTTGLRLTGTIAGAGHRYGFVVEADGRTWIVQEGDRLRDGVVRRVGRTEVEVGGVGGEGGVLLTLGGGK